MRKAFILFTLGLAVWGVDPAAHALGIGRTANSSTLGQPLNFVAAVQVDGDEVLNAKCISAAVLAGDSALRADRVRVALEPGSDARQRRVRVTTTSPIVEPLVTVNLTVGCASRVSRSFVTLINPPVLVQNEPLELEAPAPKANDASVAAAPAAVAAVAVAGPAPGRTRYVRNAAGRWVRVPATPVVAVASNGASTSSDATSAKRTVPTSGPITTPIRTSTSTSTSTNTAIASSTSTPPTAPARATVSTAAVVAARKPDAADTTPVDTEAAALTRRVDAALSAGNARRTPPQPAPAADPPIAREDHVRELEAGLATLRSDSARGQQSVAALQARLHEVEDARFMNPVVYTLGAFALLLTAIVVAMWKLLPARRPRAAEPARTHETSMRAGAAEARAVPKPRAEPPVLRDIPTLVPPPAASPIPDTLAPTSAIEKTRPVRPEDTRESSNGLEVTMVIDAELQARVKRSGRPDGSFSSSTFSSSTFASLGEAETRGHGQSMEELVDVEQQAEFYLALGQEEAAIALLDKHIASGGGSPLPYLKLLEIHQRRQDQTAYERIRDHFNERFKAYAPEWSESIESGRSLEEYPATLETVQTAWDAPMRAMKMLDGLLFRRSANEDAFDFAAYRELLFLYSIARDLSGDVSAAAMGSDIDLLLPLDEASIALLSRRMKPSLPTVSANAASIVGVDVDITARGRDDADASRAELAMSGTH